MPSINQFKYRRVQCILLFIVHSVCGDFYHSSTTRMKTVLEAQDKLINQITNFIHHQQEKISMLKGYLKLLKRERAKSLEDKRTYLDNPINAFILIKRLTVDLDLLESTIRDSPALEIDKGGYPDMNDLVGATVGLERLRVTYQLNITEMANGILKSRKSAPMTVVDCIDLANVLYQEKMYNAAIDWLAQALLKYSFKKWVSSSMLHDILSGLTYTYEELADETNTQLWKRRTFTIHKHDKSKSYRKMANELIKKQASSRISTDTEFKEYEHLCREKTNISRDVQSKLKCFYINRNNPFLKLAPFKLEQLYIDPDVDMVHDVMSDNEIQHFIDSAIPKMSRAEDIADNHYAEYRVAQLAWFQPCFSAIMERVSKRMADFSGLDLASAEELQVGNYGIAGQYEPHYDHTTVGDDYDDDAPSSIDLEFGRRYATILFYLSDVTYGGATVFTDLGLTVPPKKGAAIFWRNILPTGEGDSRTMHAACPVLIGNKWIMNRWLHEAGQEFSSPCTNDQKRSEV